MSRIIFCEKLKKEAPGFEFLPYPGELGKKIYFHISPEAFKLWQSRQTMLINEYRLSLLDPKAQEFLAEEMEKFLFGEEGEAPAGYTPPAES